MALGPLALGILAAFVAYGRWKVAPIAESSHARGGVSDVRTILIRPRCGAS